ncbi:MAG: hypothetical protein WCH34_00020 [Bacteroidota bacterium]
MKKLFAFFLTLLIGSAIFAQAPQAINYQGVARDNSGNVLASQAVKLKLSILNSSPSGTAVYVETHAKTTDGFGLISLQIGQGSVVSGTFSSINWSANSYYLKVEIDPTGGNNFQLISTNQFVSVPYALYAEQSGTAGSTGAQGIQGITGATGAQGLAGSNGITGSTGAQGIQGVTGADGALNAWSLSGNAGTLSGTNFIGTTDNVPITFKMNNTQAGKIDASNNTYFGLFSGAATTTGYQNTAFGSGALLGNNGGQNNTAVGTFALRLNSSGYQNTALGYGALYNNNGTNNTAIGFGADVAADNLNNATAIGAHAVVSASNSLVLGNNANVGIGVSAPTTTLEVNGTTKTTNLQMTNGATANYILTSDAVGNASWTAPTAGITGSGTATRIAFWNGTSSLSSSSNLFWDNTNGRLGVGVSTPSAQLHIADITDGTDALSVENSGNNGKAGSFNLSNFSNLNPAIQVTTSGMGSDGVFQINNVVSSGDVISATTNGNGRAGYFCTTGSSNNSALVSYTRAYGSAGYFYIDNPANFGTSLFGITNGIGKAGHFEINNPSNSANALYVTTNGTGNAIEANGKIKTTSLQVTNGAISGNLLTSDGSGNASWQPFPVGTVSSHSTGNTTITSSWANYPGGTITITAPMAGVITVEASVQVGINHANTSNDGLLLVIGTTTTDSGNSWDQAHYVIPNGWAAGYVYNSIYVHRTFAVSAGTYTYYLNGEMNAGQDANDMFINCSMTAQYTK